MYTQGTATGAADMLAKLHAFLTTNGSAFGLRRTGIGNGTLAGYRGGPESYAERISVLALTPTSFAVSGSVSGALGTATAGVPFECSKAAFTVTPGSTAFQAGDVLSLQTAPRWTTLSTSATLGYVWRAPGNDGAKAIYIGAKVSSNGPFLQLAALTGFTANTALASQPGYAMANFYPGGVALSTGDNAYWLVADGRRFILAARPAAGVYQCAYLGFANTYVDSVAYPYPIVQAVTAIGDAPYTENSYKNTAFVRSIQEQLMLRPPPGLGLRFDGWASFTVNNYGTGGCFIQPHSNSISTDALSGVRRNLDGTTPFFPTVLRSDQGKFVLAELAGVHCVPGDGLTAESLLDFEGLKHLVLTNVNRTSNSDFFTVALD